MNFIAKLGENPAFIAFNAHCWFAFSAVYVAGAHGYDLEAAALGFVLAAAKEFWFDATYETNPPQTFDDNIEDFAGYLAGIVLALCLV